MGNFLIKIKISSTDFTDNAILIRKNLCYQSNLRHLWLAVIVF